jgi:hypothetical protein
MTHEVGWGTVASAVASLVCLGAAVASGGWSAFWLTVGAVGFAVEAVALHRKAKGDTLSETVWAKTRPLWLRIPLAIFMAWLTVHFVLGR